jgi:hypothetical protein
VARGKEVLCNYETEPTAVRNGLTDKKSTATASPEEYISVSPQDSIETGLESDSIAQVSALGYSNANGNNTLALFKRIDEIEQHSSHPVAIAVPNSGIGVKYKTFIRQLPARPYVERLIETYFHDVNWHYSFLEKDIFLEQYKRWNDLPFSSLNKGPHELPDDLRFFPAVLFEVLAIALQFQPINYDESLNSLKYAASMSLDDLASDYSESGIGILALLGKRNTCLMAVQAGFLRTQYLKNAGLITESWHSLSQTIRDAQEIGLHRDATLRRSSSSEEALEALWLVELRRRNWLVLMQWDAHMALVLGRPTTTDQSAKIILPIDAPTPKNRKETAPFPRQENDPPTPLTLLLTSYKKSVVLREILALERDGPHPKDYTKIEKLHEMILQNEGMYPFPHVHVYF